MPAKTTAVPSGVEPNRLYNPEELSVVSGIPARRVKRMMDEGRIGYVVVGNVRGRMIRGQQYLDWLDARAVEPETF